LAAAKEGLAQPLGSLNGLINLSAVQAKVDGEPEQTLRQEYSINWSKAMTPYVETRLGFRYLKFDLTEADITGTAREELQPSAEIYWRHPWFAVTTGALRRRVESGATRGPLFTDQFYSLLRTQDPSVPILSLRYDWQHIHEEEVIPSTATRDTKDRRFQASAEYSRGPRSATYSFTQQLTDNVISGVDSKQTNQLVRLSSQSNPWDTSRLRSGISYTFDHRRQTTQTSRGGTLLEAIPISRGLYALDPTPNLGSLEPLLGLVDGNVTAPTVPPIQIGGGNVDNNIGCDLGLQRPVSALYLYTDRFSGDQLRWQVYVSPDNLNWALYTSVPQVVFNAGLLRYEIGFSTVAARYIKIVNTGLNEVVEVLVTELQAFAEVATSVDQTLQSTQTAHLADARVGYEWSQSLRSSLDLSLRNEPGVGGLGDRNSLDYAFRTLWRQSRTVSHNARWEQSWQLFPEQDGEDLRDDVVGYTFLLEPLPTLSASASGSARWGYLEGQLDQEIFSAVAEVNGRPTRVFSFLSQLGANRVNLIGFGRQSDTWTTRFSIDGAMTRTLDLILTWTYQETTVDPVAELRVRRIYNAGINFRPTNTIFARATLNWINDVSDSIIHSYLISWNLLPKVTLVGQAYINESAEDFRTERYIANLTYNLSRRSSLYVRYSDVDQTGAGGLRTTSWQQGLRITF
jgi:hypothetical protein